MVDGLDVLQNQVQQLLRRPHALNLALAVGPELHDHELRRSDQDRSTHLDRAYVIHSLSLTLEPRTLRVGAFRARVHGSAGGQGCHRHVPNDPDGAHDAVAEGHSGPDLVVVVVVVGRGELEVLVWLGLALADGRGRACARGGHPSLETLRQSG